MQLSMGVHLLGASSPQGLFQALRGGLEFIFGIGWSDQGWAPVHGPGLMFCCVLGLEALAGWSWLL